MKRKLEAGEVVFGTFFKFDAPSLIEIIGMAGFDFVIIDAEHSAFTHAGVENLVRAAELVGMSTMVRLPDASEANILHTLDSGASGVQVPALRTAAEVEAVVRMSKYHPDGERGWAPGCRAGDYAFTPAKTYIESANRDTTVAVHIENADMLDEVERLCAIKHLDILFIGTGDLSQSMGHPANPKHPDVVAAVDKVIEIANRHGKWIGAVAQSMEDAERYVQKGVRYLAWQSDLTLYKNALKGSVEKLAALKRPAQ